MSDLRVSPNRVDVNNIIETFYTHHIDGMVYECKHNPKSNILLLHSLLDDSPLAGITLYCPNEEFVTDSKIKKIIKHESNSVDFEGSVGAVNQIIEGSRKLLTSSPTRVSKNTSLSICNISDCDLHFVIEWSEGQSKLEKTLKPATAYIIKDIIFPMVFNVSITPCSDISADYRIRFARTSWKCLEYFYKWSRLSAPRKGSHNIEKPHVRCNSESAVVEPQAANTSNSLNKVQTVSLPSLHSLPKLNMDALSKLPSDANSPGNSSNNSTPRTPRSNLDPIETPPQSPRISIVKDTIRASPTRSISIINNSRRSSNSGRSGEMRRSPMRATSAVYTMSSSPARTLISSSPPVSSSVTENTSAFTEIMSSTCKIAINLGPLMDNTQHYVEDQLNLIGNEITAHYQTISSMERKLSTN